MRKNKQTEEVTGSSTKTLDSSVESTNQEVEQDLLSELEGKARDSMMRHGDAVLDFNIKRQKYLMTSLYVLGGFIILLYGNLFYWLYCHIPTPSEWRITLILAILPTTLTFFLLRALTKPEHVNGETKKGEELIHPDYLKHFPRHIGNIGA